MDHDNMPLHFLQCPKAELKQRLILGWQQRVLESTESIRTTMDGLAHADVRLTRKALHSLPDEHQGLMRCALNGTQYTNDALSHAGVVDSDQCRFCAARDSLFHRTWECPYFQDLRDALPALPRVDQHTASTLCHGWLPRSPDLTNLRRMFMQFPDTTGIFAATPVCQTLQYRDIFLDGSCSHPTEVDLRIASWACVVWDGAQFQPLSQGLVPGWRQTSLRAELTAAISALKSSVDQAEPCRLWIDNESVQTMIANWIHGFDPPWAQKQDADLWFQLHAQFQHSRPFVVAAQKVQAHSQRVAQETILDDWAVWGNASADVHAEDARRVLSADFWQTWNNVRQHQSNTWRSGYELHRLFVQIGLRAQATSIANQVAVPQQPPPSIDMTLDPGVRCLSRINVADLPKHLQVDETFHVLRWLRGLTTQDHGVSWISYHQLLIDYQLVTGRLGPYTNGKKWTARGHSVEYNYPQQVQHMGRFLQNLAKANKEPLQTDQRRPSSLTLAFWCGCVKVAMSEQRISEIDDFYKKGAARLPIRQIARDMSGIQPGFTI